MCPACPASGLPQNLLGGYSFGEGAFYTRDMNNIGPRAGFTYQATRQMVVRGGYGLTFLDSSTDRGTSTGFTRATPYIASLDSNRTPANRLANPYPNGLLVPAGAAGGASTALGTSINYDINDRRIPEFHQWSVGVQHELFWKSVLEVAYVGSSTRKIGINRPVNSLTADEIALGDAFLNALVPNPFVGLVPDGGSRNTAATIQRRELLRSMPQFVNITERLVPIGTLDYQALQVSWNKRLSSGIHFQINYTGARNTGATTVLNMGEAPFEEVTDTHRPHVLLFTGGWILPRFESRNAVVKHVLGGWQVNASTFFRSGLTLGMPDNVDLIGDPVLANPTKQRAFNTCTLTAAGARQNCATRRRAAGVQDPSRQRARHHRRAARERVSQRPVDPRHVVLQELPADVALQLPDARRAVQPHERRAVAGREHQRHIDGLRHGRRNAVERSAVRADCVQADLLRRAFFRMP